MSYKIVNKQGRALNGFHSNGGWNISDVFPCSLKSWIIFETKNKADKYLKKMLSEAEKQKDRWGDWTNIALEFINTLKVIKH